MWICTDSPYHDRFTCVPAWAEFDRKMETMKLHEWKEVTCLECGVTALWVKDEEDLRKTLTEEDKDEQEITDYIWALRQQKVNK